jgi:hypothetical protein
MAFKVNYGLERAERNRAKQAKRDAKAKAKKSAAEPGVGSEPDAGLDEVTAGLPQATSEHDVAGEAAQGVQKDD